MIPPLEEEHIHNFSPDWTHDSTNHWHECDCGGKSELTNHISSGWIVNTPATTDLEGVQIKNCTICGIELDRSSIDKLPNGGNSGGNGGGENSGGNGKDDNDGGSDNNDGSDNNGGSTSEDNSNPGMPTVTPPAVTSPADTPQSAPGIGGSPDKITETQPTQQPEGLPEQDVEPKNTDTDTQRQDSSDPAQTDSKPQPESEAVQTAQAYINDGRIVIDGGNGFGDGSSTGSGNLADGGRIATGNVPGMADAGAPPKTSTSLTLGDGAVIVTVVCEQQECTAGVADTAAVANAVLAPEQIQLANDGETIEIRIDVKDISETVTGQDKEVIESGLAEYQKEIPELTLGMYIDISMFIRIGEGGWDAVTSTEEPIEVIIGIPEELMGDGREFYIIRAHAGEYTLLNDMDNALDTITISTDLFSAYAIAYRQTDEAGENHKCGLCHICPTFLGICYFIWLAVIIAAILVIMLIVWCKRGEKEQQT